MWRWVPRESHSTWGRAPGWAREWGWTPGREKVWWWGNRPDPWWEWGGRWRPRLWRDPHWSHWGWGGGGRGPLRRGGGFGGFFVGRGTGRRGTRGLDRKIDSSRRSGGPNPIGRLANRMRERSDAKRNEHAGSCEKARFALWRGGLHP